MAMMPRLEGLRAWFQAHRPIVLRIGGATVLGILLLQLLYPAERMLPFAQVESIAVSGWAKKDAIWHLDDLASRQAIEVSLGKSGDSYDAAKPSDIGLGVGHESSVEGAKYPWYMRLIPTSLLWFGLLQREDAPSYTFDKDMAKQYLTQKIGKGCVIPAKNATLKRAGDSLSVVPATAGGTCQEDEAVATLSRIKPRLGEPARVHIPVTVIAPAVGDDQAQTLANQLNASSDTGVTLNVAGDSQTIPQKEVLSWLTFSSTDKGLSYRIESKKADVYLSKTAAPKVSKPAGITKVSTLDFTETSRNEGVSGKAMALGATVANITKVLEDEAQAADLVVTTLAPKVQYSRSYTKTSTGIAAQMQHYDDDNAGDFGVAFIEIGGRGLSAQHNGNRQFVTASTYKLFVAFSTIKRVEAGKMKWSDADIANGRNLSTCFDDMIVKSDNACAESLIRKIGAKGLNDDIKSLGLASSGFRSDNNVTTPNDLANYLRQLETGTMPIKSENRTRLLSTMKRNVYRQGVPAGASGQVADKVGFLWGLLHDATIVYSPKGTYVLVVLTDGSSWANIAELTRKIEALR